MMGELSYFTNSKPNTGSIVSVPLRSKKIFAIVTNTRPVSDLKTEIKQATYEIKKLGKIESLNSLPTSFMETCTWLADFYATHSGAVIDAFISDMILENISKIKSPKHYMTDNQTPSTQKDIHAVQGDDEDRLSSWRSVIRQEFARKKSVVIYVPTTEDGRYFFNSLEKGVEGYIFLFNSEIKQQTFIDNWNKIHDMSHPVVIIATPSFILNPRDDIETIILERENSRGWISLKYPYMDGRIAIEKYANLQNQKIYIADSVLRVETLYRLHNHDITESAPFKWRSISNAKDLLIDMRMYKSSENNFKVISPELEQLINFNKINNTRLFILTTRRGISPMTVCDDCESVVTCKKCSSPVVTHASRESGRNFFMCHKCGERRSADEACITCGGWRLTPLGIGTERIVSEIHNKLPDVEVLRLDSDATKTDRQISKTLEKFYSLPGSVLVGTELAMLHIRDNIEHIAIVSIDSLFALPEFRMSEKIMYILTRLRNKATQTILVQTRKPEEKIFEYGLKGNLSEFYRNTIEERERFFYPPFSFLIKITIEGKKDIIAEDMSRLTKIMEPYEIDIFPAFTSTIKGNYMLHGLIKIKNKEWPDPELINKIRILPQQIKVRIQAESLL
jgi:primosomal protein N' (replication factor Y)